VPILRGAEARVIAERIFLTTSTSEAYSWLFRLLCDAGDEVLIAQPSYPLFRFSGADRGCAAGDVSAGVRPRVADRFCGAAGAGDAADESDCGGASEQSHGTLHEGGERRELERICAEHGLALIVDEVFLDYAMSGLKLGALRAGLIRC